MKKLLLIWIFAFFVISNIVYSVTDYSVGSYILMDNATYDSTGRIINENDFMVAHGWNETTAGTGKYGSYSGKRVMNITNGAQYNQSFKSETNETWGANFIWCVLATSGVYDDYVRWENNSAGNYINIEWIQSNANLVWQNVCSGTALGSGGVFSTDLINSRCKNVTLIFTKTYVNVSINGTWGTNCSHLPTLGRDSVILISVGGGGDNALITDFKVFNGTGFPQTVASSQDITPPEINQDSYNMTSEGGEGCINWRTDKSNPCSTSDTTPTLNFTTNENAWCAIGTQNINLSNYTALAINRNCTSGQGTTSHTCTLASEDELVYDTSYIYIGCQDSSGNQNLTSTSGALALSITGLEAAGRTSIGIGIQNALLSGYTNYTDQQIYARNLSNAQVKGTFDRAVKKGSKTWAFNRIGVSDSHVNMFNLTPVLYTLEFANKTSSNITLEVEKLLNATK